MTRRLRQLFCRLLMATLLFSQWAVASYACPTLASPAAGDASMVAMSDCQHMAGMHDTATPNLCVEHCQHGQQSVDRADAPSLAAALLASVYPLPLVSERYPLERQPAAPGTFVAASPPHEILHCCFRI